MSGTDDPLRADEDFEIEVTPLGAERADGGEPYRGADRRPAERLAARSPFAPHLTPRRRAFAALLAAGSVVLALLVLLTSVPGADATLRRMLRLPTPTLPPWGTDELILAHAVPWGQLEIDGREAKDLGKLSILGNQYLSLATGGHTLTYSAQLFPTLRCHVSAPAREEDTCPLLHLAIAGAAGGALRTLDLGATPERLPPAERARLIAAVRTTLETRAAAVAPGEHYLDGDGRAVVAAGPLTATLQIAINADPAQAMDYAGAPCVSLCSVMPWISNGEPPTWVLAANVYPTWSFGDADGRVIASDVPVSTLGAGNQLIPVIASYQKGVWVVSNRDSTAPSHILFAAVTAILPRLDPQLSAAFPTGYVSVPIMAPNPADGCKVVIGDPKGSGSGFPNGDNAEVLYRFGVLLAANDRAHRVLPDLPVATQAELDRWRSVS